MRQTLFLVKKLHPVPAIVWGLFICIATLLPGDNVPDFQWKFIVQADKWAHFFLFLIFAFLLCGGWHLKNKWTLTAAVLYAFSCALFLGVFTELLQQFVVPNRFGDWKDLLADACGAFTGVLIYAMMILWLRKKLFSQ